MGRPQDGAQSKGQTVALGRRRLWGAEWLAAGSGLCSAVLGSEGVLSCSQSTVAWQVCGLWHGQSRLRWWTGATDSSREGLEGEAW